MVTRNQSQDVYCWVSLPVIWEHSVLIFWSKDIFNKTEWLIQSLKMKINKNLCKIIYFCTIISQINWILGKMQTYGSLVDSKLNGSQPCNVASIKRVDISVNS